MLRSQVADETRLRVKYSGAALNNGLMSVVQFAEALDGLADTLRLCGTLINGDETETTLAISANIRQGSFGFEVVLGLAAASAANFLTAANVKSALEIAKVVFGEDGLLEIFKRTKGEPPSRVDHFVLEDGSIQINGDVHAPITINNHFTVSPDQWKCYESEKVREAIWGTISPLEARGIDEVGFTIADGDETRVNSGEAKFYVPKKDSYDGEADLTTYEAVLTVVKQSFARRRRWNFESLQGSFGAVITDPDFLARQDRRQVSIHKGDRIRAIVSVRRFAPERRGMKPREPDYFIKEVLEIIPPPQARDDERQTPLEFN